MEKIINFSDISAGCELLPCKTLIKNAVKLISHANRKHDITKRFYLYFYTFNREKRERSIIQFLFASNSLKGHGNEADFLGFLQKSVPHESLTLPFEPF